MATSKRTHLLLIAALATTPIRAHAAPSPGEVDRAEALFLQARDLMEAGRYSEACPKLVEAQRLDPGAGTLLALALCHEGEGRGATAIDEFREAGALAHKAGREDRADLAAKNLKKLEAEVSRVTVAPDAPSLEGLSILLDQRPLPKAQWGVAIYVDAGAHLVVASAPGKKSWSTAVNVNGYGDVKRVAVPELEAASSDGATSSGSNATAWVLGGIGVAALGVGGYFGVRTFTKTRQYKDACPGGTCPDQHGIDLNSDAKRSGTISTIAFGVGVVSLASAVILVLTKPSPSGALKTDALITPTSIGFGLRGDF